MIEALRIDPRDLFCRGAVIQICTSTGDLVEGMKHAEAALKIDFDNHWINLYINKLLRSNNLPSGQHLLQGPRQ